MSDALKLTKIEFISGKYGEKYKHPNIGCLRYSW